ncbi:MAG: RimJ/RimL family protein N-acetyltransferase [Patiriisocius sp.]|jgi:RimJ/RimL family protein N-acetyltransferase
MTNKRQVFLKGTDIDLVLLTADDASTMASWINNEEVTQFLSMGKYPMTLENENVFIENAYKSTDHLVLGIYHKKDKKLIGNTGFHRIDQLNQTASFGIIIGEKAYWSKGIGTKVLELMLTYAFTKRNLRNVRLSVLGNNPRGKRCYEKCGFTEVGSYPNHLFKAGAWHDEILMIVHNPLST